MDFLWGMVSRFRRFARDAAGLFLFALALMTLLTILGFTQGALLSSWTGFLRQWLGWGSVLVVIGLSVGGLFLLNPRGWDQRSIPWVRILALEMAAFALIALLSASGGHSLDRAEAGLDGGLIGWGLVEFLGLFIGLPLQIGLLTLILVWGVLAGLGVGSRLQGLIQNWVDEEAWREQAVASKPVVSVAGKKENEVAVKKKEPRIEKARDLPPEYQKRLKIEEKEKISVKPPPRDELLPPLDILKTEKAARPDERNINLTAGLIEKTLAEFGIPAKVVSFQVGPTVTQFAVEPGFVERPGPEGEVVRNKVRVSQISALSRDLALALSAERLRIQAPVPGRPYVGIEVPNLNATTVRLRPILESAPFYKIGSPLGIAIGRDVSGDPIVADLASMPHLLIAGATGSGKSVCIAAITTCLAMNNSPEDLRLVMVDPKMVELVRFNGLPHLYGKVETDMDRMLAVLRWTVAEMDRRYKLLEEGRSRDLDAYNKKMRRRKGGRLSLAWLY